MVAVVEAQEDAKWLFSQTHSCRFVMSVLVSILSDKKTKSPRKSQSLCVVEPAEPICLQSSPREQLGPLSAAQSRTFTWNSVPYTYYLWPDWDAQFLRNTLGRRRRFWLQDQERNSSHSVPNLSVEFS